MYLKNKYLARTLNCLLNVCLLTTFLVSSSIYATSFEEGMKAYEASDYQSALQVWLPLAELGDADAQFLLGTMYDNGTGVTQDYNQAIKWYTLAAKQADSDAQTNLAYLYWTGKGVAKDFKESIKWYKLAAKQGDPIAQNNIGKSYQYGYGTTIDYKQAVEWYLLAAQQGNVNSQSSLGALYQYGTDIDQNYSEAFKWSTLASKQGDAFAQNDLGLLYEYGSGVEKSYKKAFELYSLATKQGSKSAKVNLESLQSKNKSSNWNLKNNRARVSLVDWENSLQKFITAQVAFSSGGDRNIYFRFEYKNLKCEQTKNNAKPLVHIWHFNNQAVRMNAWCEKFSGSENRYYQLTPKSNEGFKFVVSAFRKAKSSVTVKINNLSFDVPAIGFTKVWSSTTSNAL